MSALCEIRNNPLSIDECIAAVSGSSVGGIATFVGTVRDINDGRTVTLLEYEAYGEMAEKEMRSLADGVEAEIGGVRVACLHRIGSLKVGDIAVVCAASAEHRDEAFRACRATIDRIKANVPIWKREHGPDGPYWVGWEDARCTGDHDDAHGHHDHHPRDGRHQHHGDEA